jgi:hypothetical protein
VQGGTLSKKYVKKEIRRAGEIASTSNLYLNSPINYPISPPIQFFQSISRSQEIAVSK